MEGWYTSLVRMSYVIGRKWSEIDTGPIYFSCVDGLLGILLGTQVSVPCVHTLCTASASASASAGRFHGFFTVELSY
jgi:hypothetical protein